MDSNQRQTAERVHIPLLTILARFSLA